MTGRSGEKQIKKLAASPTLRVEPPECEQPIRHSGSREATIRNLERNNGLLDTPSTSLRVVSPSTLLRTVSLSNGLSNHGSRLRLVQYDVWGRFPAYSAAC